MSEAAAAYMLTTDVPLAFRNQVRHLVGWFHASRLVEYGATKVPGYRRTVLCRIPLDYLESILRKVFVLNPFKDE